jgi:succinate-semialdehyde dehydrogenase / glutarate-semialdehyde dehydrogenase
VFEPFLDKLITAMNKVRVGDGLEDGVTMGPLANERRVRALQGLVDDAISSGGELRMGGKRMGERGYFFEPTVLANVPQSARIMSEEPFGPIAVVNAFDSLDDMIAEANRLPYGLCAFAYTRSAKQAHRIAAEVETGMLTINQIAIAFPEVPFGGVKDSGYGTEGGAEAIDAYLNLKYISQLDI